MDIMRKTDVRAVDLNLLVALDALLRERSVSRAATDVDRLRKLASIRR